MPCPDCKKLLPLIAALKKHNRALRVALVNSKRSLDAQGPAIKKAERAVREIEEESING